MTRPLIPMHILFWNKRFVGEQRSRLAKSVSSTHNMIFCWPLNWIGEVAKPFTQMPPMMNVLKMSITYSIREFLRRPQKEHHAGLGPSLLFSMVMVVCSPPSTPPYSEKLLFHNNGPHHGQKCIITFFDQCCRYLQERYVGLTKKKSPRPLGLLLFKTIYYIRWKSIVFTLDKQYGQESHSVRNPLKLTSTVVAHSAAFVYCRDISYERHFLHVLMAEWLCISHASTINRYYYVHIREY
jgi:hypothetical protein